MAVRRRGFVILLLLRRGPVFAQHGWASFAASIEKSAGAKAFCNSAKLSLRSVKTGKPFHAFRPFVFSGPGPPSICSAQHASYPILAETGTGGVPRQRGMEGGGT
jgi:hypothetical protein